MQEVVGKAAREGSCGVGAEREVFHAVGGACIFLPDGKYLVEPLPVVCRDVLHVGHVLQPPLYLEARYACVHHLLKAVAAVHVL